MVCWFGFQYFDIGRYIGYCFDGYVEYNGSELEF